MSRAARRVQSVRRRLEAQVPLFLATGLESPPTLDEAQHQVDEHAVWVAERFARMDARRAETLARAAEMRARVAAVVTPERLAELDRAREPLPKGPEYDADHWWQELRRLGLL